MDDESILAIWRRFVLLLVLVFVGLVFEFQVYVPALRARCTELGQAVYAVCR